MDENFCPQCGKIMLMVNPKLGFTLPDPSVIHSNRDIGGVQCLKNQKPWANGTNYIDYSDLVLLASIETPREITDSADLHDLNLLASQELISFGTTMYRGMQNEIFTIPTSKLSEYGQVVLKYMRSKMDNPFLRRLQNDANSKSERTDKWLRKNNLQLSKTLQKT